MLATNQHHDVTQRRTKVSTIDEMTCPMSNHKGYVKHWNIKFIYI